MTMEIPYYKLRTFYLVVMEGSFKKAAARLCVTEGAVSQQIKDLEVRLGKKLFHRSSRNLTLTTDGLNLFNLVAPIINRFEIILDEFDRMSGTVKGKIKIASYGAILLNVLPKYLFEFRKKYPECEIFLINASGKDLDSIILSEMVDFGIGSVENVSQGIIGQEVWSFKRYFIAPLGHPLTKKKKLTWSDIANTAIVMPRPGSGSKFYKTLERYNPNLKVTVEAGAWEIVMKYVEMGFGVSIMPEVMIQEKDKKRLYFRDLCEIDPEAGVSRYGLLIKRGKYLSPASREFIKILCPQFDFNLVNK